MCRKAGEWRLLHLSFSSNPDWLPFWKISLNENTLSAGFSVEITKRSIMASRNALLPCDLTSCVGKNVGQWGGVCYEAGAVRRSSPAPGTCCSCTRLPTGQVPVPSSPALCTLVSVPKKCTCRSGKSRETFLPHPSEAKWLQTTVQHIPLQPRYML